MSHAQDLSWQNLPKLQAQEIETLTRFEKDPRGTLFVAVADIFRKRGRIAESISILQLGLERFPHYHSARAALAKDLFTQDNYTQAVAELDRVLARSPDNLMAQRLRLALSVLLDPRNETNQRLNVLRQLYPEDPYIQKLRVFAEEGRWEEAKQFALGNKSGLRENSVVAPKKEERYELTHQQSRNALTAPEPEKTLESSFTLASLNANQSGRYLHLRAFKRLDSLKTAPASESQAGEDASSQSQGLKPLDAASQRKLERLETLLQKLEGIESAQQQSKGHTSYDTQNSPRERSESGMPR